VARDVRPGAGLHPFGLLFVGSFVVWIWALVDAIQVPDDSMYRSGTKLVWVLVIVLTQVVGAIIYFAIGRPPRRAAPTGPPPPPRLLLASDSLLRMSRLQGRKAGGEALH
jgi:Phospholipase_D-nuclease N-terminal